MRFSIAIILLFVLGIIAGLYQFFPITIVPRNLSFYVLCLLMFFVGLSIGKNIAKLKTLKSLPKRVLLLPIVTAVGTFAGMIVLSLLIRSYTLSDLLAIGSGFGYYSLSSVIITEYKGVELGAIALLANVIRELFTLTLSPLLVRLFGRLSPISAGGATTADTSLPIIIKSSGEEFAFVSIYHGLAIDLSVPFLVGVFCLL